MGDLPLELNVHLLKNAANPLAVYSSKAVGEPPFFLGGSVYFAIKNAIYAYREENGFKEFMAMDSPATVERIRMSCADDITKIVLESQQGDKKQSYEKFQTGGSF